MTKLGVCAIFKNESRYLREWVLYNKLIGFDELVLYDNGSSDGSLRVLSAPDVQPTVTVVPWPARPGQQAAYQHFTLTFAHRYDWVAFIDVDEFIVPLNSRDIRSCLPVAGDHSALLMNWLNFGPASHTSRPFGFVTQNYDHRLPDDDPWNHHVKSLVRVADILDCSDPHTASLRGLPCNSRGETVGNVAVQPRTCHDNVVVNHYYTKCSMDWQEKLERGRATTEERALRRTQAMFDYHRAHGTVPDDRIQRFLPRLRSSFYG